MLIRSLARSGTISTATLSPPAPRMVARYKLTFAENVLRWVKAFPFLTMHLACFAVIWTGVSSVGVGLCLLFFFARMFGVTAGYHRYFSHKSYKTSRVFQFFLAWLGC